MQTEIVEKIAKLLSGEANQAEINEINAWRNEAAEHERYFNESYKIKRRAYAGY